MHVFAEVSLLLSQFVLQEEGPWLGGCAFDYGFLKVSRVISRNELARILKIDWRDLTIDCPRTRGKKIYPCNYMDSSLHMAKNRRLRYDSWYMWMHHWCVSFLRSSKQMKHHTSVWSRCCCWEAQMDCCHGIHYTLRIIKVPIFGALYLCDDNIMGYL